MRSAQQTSFRLTNRTGSRGLRHAKLRLVCSIPLTLRAVSCSAAVNAGGLGRALLAEASAPHAPRTDRAGRWGVENRELRGSPYWSGFGVVNSILDFCSVYHSRRRGKEEGLVAVSVGAADLPWYVSLISPASIAAMGWVLSVLVSLSSWVADRAAVAVAMFVVDGGCAVSVVFSSLVLLPLLSRSAWDLLPTPTVLSILCLSRSSLKVISQHGGCTQEQRYQDRGH